MSSIILKASSEILNPPADTPYLPDIATGLYLKFQASDLELAEAANVESWVASSGSGAGSGNGALNSTIAGCIAPVFSVGGGPAGGSGVDFTSALSQIRNAAATSLAAPLSVAMLVKSTGSGWVFSLGNAVVVRYIASSGYMAGSSTTSDNILSGELSTDWVPLIYSWGGPTADSKLLVGRDSTEIRTGTVSPVSGSRICLGAPSTTVAGFVGSLSEIQLFSRVLTDEDMFALQYTLNEIIANG